MDFKEYVMRERFYIALQYGHSFTERALIFKKLCKKDYFEKVWRKNYELDSKRWKMEASLAYRFYLLRHWLQFKWENVTNNLLKKAHMQIF